MDLRRVGGARLVGGDARSRGHQGADEQRSPDRSRVPSPRGVCIRGHGGFLSLGGCAQFKDFLAKTEKAVTLVTKTYTNPVTKTDLYEVELGIKAAVSVLKAYKSACQQGLADTNCRANVAAIQAYTRQLPPLLAQLRDFVKNNDQVNAITIYNQIVDLVTNLKNAARNVGINVGN